MQTIILCGGIGTRLKEETEYKPKPMVLIGNKPIIWHIMKTYSYYGFKNFILALGYKADYIKDFFLNQKAYTSDFTLETKSHRTKFFLKSRADLDDFNITFVDTGLETLQGERIKKCQKYIPATDAHFMVTYGDAVTDLNIKELLAFHKRQKTLGTITGVHPHSKYSRVTINKENKITKFTDRPVLSDWVNGGFMVFQRKALKYFDDNETDHVALRRLIAQQQLSIYKHEGFWYAVDTFKEYEELNAIWNSGEHPWKIWDR